jgi:DNA-directed RNA polymerase sigma subunit (sigma70/sigma32)
MHGPFASDTDNEKIREAMAAKYGPLAETLAPREVLIIAWRDGLIDGPRKVNDIGAKLGLTGGRIRQLEKQARAKLAADDYPDDPPF